MKIRFITLSFAGILMLSALFLTFCKKEEIIIFDKYPDELIGSWDIVSGIPQAIITTNSDQQTRDFSGLGNGSLQVTGEHEVGLNYIYGDVEMLIISNKSFIDLFSDGEFPVYMLVFYPGFEGAVFQVMISEEEIFTYSSETSGIIFDPESNTITVEDQQLLSGDDSTSVTINGSLSFNMINIPANTPTAIPSWMGGTLVNGEFIFSDNGNLSATIEGEGITGSWEATEGDSLHIVFIDTSMTGTDQYDSLAFSYKLTLGILTLNYDGEALCQETAGFPREDCLAEREEEYSLDPGSLIEISEGFTMILTKSQGTAKALISDIRYQISELRFGDKRKDLLINRLIMKE